MKVIRRIQRIVINIFKNIKETSNSYPNWNSMNNQTKKSRIVPESISTRSGEDYLKKAMELGSELWRLLYVVTETEVVSIYWEGSSLSDSNRKRQKFDIVHVDFAIR